MQDARNARRSTVDNLADAALRPYNSVMDHIRQHLQKVEHNMRINSVDPIAQHGFTQLPNFILRNPDLTANAKTVYSLLLSYAWHNDLCFPGQERLAEHMGTHVSTVSRAIAELENCSLIEIERRGQGKTNFYTINFVVKKKGRNT
jgi:Helix-turn-helix domain